MANDANRMQQISQMDPGGALKNSHDFDGQSFRVRDTVSAVQDFFTHYRAVYTGDNPTEVTYYLGTQPHITNVGLFSDSSGSLNNKYFQLYDARTEQAYHIWYNVSGGGTDPAPAGSIGFEIPIVTNDSAQIVAKATEMYVEADSEGFRLFNVQQIGSTLKITNKRFGTSPNSTDATTGFLITNTPGEQREVKKVLIDYNGDNPIYEGEELKGYKYNIFTGKFELLVSIGSVTVDFDPVTGETPFISNLTLGVAGTEGSLVLPIDTVKFKLRTRSKAKLQFSYVSGQSGTTFFTVDAGSTHEEEGLRLIAGKTIYVQAPNKGSADIELTYWT